MATRLADPSVQRFDPTELVISYNGLLHNQADHYAIGRYECAMEFLSSPGLRGEGILNNLEFVPGFLTNYEQQGFCPRCGVLGRLLILNMARLGDNGVVSKTRCFSMISSSITRRWSLPPLGSHKMEILPSLAKPVQLPWFLNQITGSHMWRKVTFGGVLTRCWMLRFSRILLTTRVMN